MHKIITFILLVALPTGVFSDSIEFTKGKVSGEMTFVENFSAETNKLNVNIALDSTKFDSLFSDLGLFDFPNSLTGKRVSGLGEFLVFFHCGKRPGKTSNLIIFDSKYNKILKHTISPGQGPFNLDYIGNSFLIDEHIVALVYTNKIIAFDFGQGNFTEYFSQKIPIYKSSYTSAKILNFGNTFVIFNSSFTPYNNKIPWFFKYGLENKSVKLKKTSYLSNTLTKIIAGDIWELNNSNIDRSSQKFFELWSKPAENMVLKGENKGDYYFYNPTSEILLFGNCLTETVQKYTTFKRKTATLINNIIYNKFSKEVWIICKSKNRISEIVVLNSNLKYKNTMILKINNTHYLNIYNIHMLDKSSGIAIYAIEKEKNSGLVYKIGRIQFN
jgi:hypothetical protein